MTVRSQTDSEFVDCDAATGEFVIDTLPAGDVAIFGHSVTHDVGATTSGRRGATSCFAARRRRTDRSSTSISPRFAGRACARERVVAETPTGYVEPKGVARSSFDNSVSRFPLTPPVTLRFLAAPEHEPMTLRLDRVPHGPVELRIRPRRNTALGDDVSLRGVVTIDGAPVTWSDGAGGAPRHGHRFLVVAERQPGRKESDDPPWLVADTVTRPDGSFVFDGLVAGPTR